MNSPRLTAVLVAEGVGTFLFVFVGAGAVILTSHRVDSGGLIDVAMAHGLALAVLVSALGAISGGHFNPAVTFGVWMTGHIGLMRGVLYVLAQLVGGLAAGLMLRGLFSLELWQRSNIGTPAVTPAISIAAAIAVEAVLTVLLVLTVFGTAIDRRAPKLGGIAIGLAVAAGVLMAGPLTGAAMNPARWFGPAVASTSFESWYVWLIGPLLGAAVAALLYRFVLEDRAEAGVAPATPEGVVDDTRADVIG